MPKSLSTRRHLRLFTTYLETGCLQKTGKICRFDRNRLSEIAKQEGWEQKRREVMSKAQDKVAQVLPNRIAQNLVQIQRIKDYIIKRMKAGKMRVSPADYDKMIRLEAFLLGEPDSRPDNRSNNIVQIYNIDGKSKDEIKKETDRLFRLIYSGNGSPGRKSKAGR